MTEEEKGKGDDRREVAGRDHIGLCRHCKDCGFCFEWGGGPLEGLKQRQNMVFLSLCGVTLVRITWEGGGVGVGERNKGGSRGEGYCREPGDR